MASKDRTETPTNAIGNPYGDFEFKSIEKAMPVLRKRDLSGHAIKIVAPYIDLIPTDRDVKVIFMTRDFSEIVSSLLAMKVIWEHGPEQVVPAAVRWLENAGISPLFIKFDQLLKYPVTTIEQVAGFIDMDLDQKAAIKALDYNSRRGVKKLDDGRELIGFNGVPVVVNVRGGGNV